MEVTILHECSSKFNITQFRRSNNFFHGIWRIPINEIDRPGCFAYHMGRSVTLLIEVLRETSDHRILMELSLALQPEPEPDKKYLYDSEREQQANLASSLVVQVLRNRLQELKENPSSVKNDGHYSSPQQVIIEYILLVTVLSYPLFRARRALRKSYRCSWIYSGATIDLSGTYPAKGLCSRQFLWNLTSNSAMQRIPRKVRKP